MSDPVSVRMSFAQHPAQRHSNVSNSLNTNINNYQSNNSGNPIVIASSNSIGSNPVTTLNSQRQYLNQLTSSNSQVNRNNSQQNSQQKYKAYLENQQMSQLAQSNKSTIVAGQPMVGLGSGRNVIGTPAQSISTLSSYQGGKPNQKFVSRNKMNELAQANSVSTLQTGNQNQQSLIKATQQHNQGLQGVAQQLINVSNNRTSYSRQNSSRGAHREGNTYQKTKKQSLRTNIMVKKNNKETRDSIKTTIHMRETLNNIQPANSSQIIEQSYQQLEPSSQHDLQNQFHNKSTNVMNIGPQDRSLNNIMVQKSGSIIVSSSPNIQGNS